MNIGKIVNKNSGVEIPVDTFGIKGVYLDTRIEGSTVSNMLLKTEWDFIPTPPPLPTEPGFYRPKKYEHWVSAYFLDQNGNWNYINNRTGESKSVPLDEVDEFGELVRLVPEQTA